MKKHARFKISMSKYKLNLPKKINKKLSNLKEAVGRLVCDEKIYDYYYYFIAKNHIKCYYWLHKNKCLFLIKPLYS